MDYGDELSLMSALLPPIGTRETKVYLLPITHAPTHTAAVRRYNRVQSPSVAR